MAHMIRLLVLSAVVLTIVFVCVDAYLREGKRSELEAKWNSRKASGRAAIAGTDDIEAGVKAYSRSLRRRLVILIYLLPLLLIAAIVYTPAD